MATFTVTTIKNIDELTAKTGGDIYNINGGTLTIDQHSRFGLNNSNASATAATSMGSVTISATLGGNCNFDGRYIRLIEYTGGIGIIPALNSAVTQGSASGKLMCVYSSLTSAPLTSGVMPSTGWIQIKQWNEVEYTAGNLTLSGIISGVRSSGASKVGFLEIMGDDNGSIIANRLGTYNVTGEWYSLGTTSGVSNQTIQIPNHGTNRYISGVFIEKTAGQKDYEFYPNAGTATTIGTESERGKVVWIDASGLVRIGNNGSATMGYTPVVGLEVVIGNIFFCTNTAAARNAVVIPNASIGTRYDYNTAGGGVINIDKCESSWCLYIIQAYSCNVSNSGFVDSIIVQEVATPMMWSKVGVGNKPTTAMIAPGIYMYYNYAGGTFSDCVFTSVSLETTGLYTTHIKDSVGLTFNRCTFRANTIQGHANVFSIYGVRLKDTTFNDCVIIEGANNFVMCDGITCNNHIYINCVSGNTVTTHSSHVWNISSNTTNCTFNGLSLPVLNCQPYTALLVGATGCSGIKLRNIGTRISPLSLGSVNNTAYIYIVGSNCSDFKMQRIYVASTRTGQMVGDNSCHEIVEENVFSDYADATDVMACLNMKRKGSGATGSLAAQVSVYGTHWRDGFTSTTAGRVVILMNEPTVLTTGQVTLANGAAFTNAGGLYMPVIGHSATFEMPEYIIGHTGFGNSALVMAGSTNTRYNYNYAIDKNDGAGWSSLTTNDYTPTTLGTALNGITGIDASKGFKLRIKITTITSNTAAITSVYMTTISTTTAQDYQYPLDRISLKLIDLKVGSEVISYVGSNPATSVEIGGIESSGTFFSFFHDNVGQSGYIQIFALGYIPITLPITYSSTDQVIPIQQQTDRVYNNS